MSNAFAALASTKKKKASTTKDSKKKEVPVSAEPAISAEELDRAVFSQSFHATNWADDSEDDDFLPPRTVAQEPEVEPGWSKVIPVPSTLPQHWTGSR